MPRTALLLVALALAACAPVPTEPVPGHPAHHVEGGFRNPNPDYRRADAWTRVSFLSRRVWQSIVAPRSFTAPRAKASRRGPVSAQEAVVTWVGHATVLVELDGVSVLTDPQWSDRASPLSWLGPRRLSPPGIPFDDLPRIDVVLISHDHYDHLDLPTVRRLAQAHAPRFLVPLGMKAWFEANGIARVEELDWWESREYRGLRFVCTPTQHFAQRSPWDSNRRLWSSWAVIGRQRRFYFSGDTGYFAGFKEIGERLGPFDLAAVAIGAYLPRRMMLPHHLSPEEAVHAFEDLRGRVLLGIHWGTFDLADEPLDEPPRLMLAEAARRGIASDRAWILPMGEPRRW